MRRIGCVALALVLVGCGRLGYETTDAGADAGVDAGGEGDAGVDASVADGSVADASVASPAIAPQARARRRWSSQSASGAYRSRGARLPTTAPTWPPAMVSSSRSADPT